VPSAVPPEGFDAQVTFDATRAVRQLWLAVDPLRTIAAVYPSARHEQIASRARDVLEQYRATDPVVMHEPDDYSDALLAAQAQSLHRYLAQPFKLWEHVASVCGESTPYDELLDAVETMLTSS
jgi:F0F1-type ATP synthase beta subunit